MHFLNYYHHKNVVCACVRACVIRIINRQRKLQYFSTSSFPGIKCLVQITFLKKKKRLLFNYAYVYVYGFCICVQVPVRPKTAIPFPEARVTGNCESPGISGRNWTLVLDKSKGNDPWTYLQPWIAFLVLLCQKLQKALSSVYAFLKKQSGIS